MDRPRRGNQGLLSAEENLTWLCAAAPAGQPRGDLAALADVGLRGFEGRSPATPLSAGQQRGGVWPACTWTHRPCGSSMMNPFTALDKQGWRNLERTWPGIASAAGWWC